MSWRSRDLGNVTPALSYTFDEGTTLFNLPADRNIRVTRTVDLTLKSDPTDLAAVANERLERHEAIRRYVHVTYELYERIFEAISCDEGFWIPPVHKLRHPMIFYMGHTATFYINKLVLGGLTSRINPQFEECFAVGVDEMSWDDLNESHYDWPMVHEVWAYRRLVRQRLEELFTKYRDLGGVPLPLTFDNSTDDDRHTFYWTMAMGIEHERIHMETASVHLRELPMRLVRDLGFWNPCKEGILSLEAATTALAENPMVAFEGAEVAMGRPAGHKAYGWDCDYSAGLTIPVAPFKAQQRLVSNAEFYQFVVAGGYNNTDLWDEEGLRWVSWKKPTHPWFWVETTEAGAPTRTFKLRCQVSLVDLPWDWPVETNHLEAKAYAKWRSQLTGRTLRLPTEAEWTLMRDVCVGSLGDQPDWPTDKPFGANINFEHEASSCPVTRFQHGPLFDVIGNVWQHLDTPVYPFKGFRVHPLYDDFSMPTFDGRHWCMKGGCWIATGNEATRDARYAFRRHFFQFIGIRLVDGPAVDETQWLNTGSLGMDPMVDEATAQAYAPRDENSHWQLVGSVLQARRFFGKSGHQRACNLGCGAGRTTFELTHDFDEVIGSDFTARLLQPAFAMRERGTCSYAEKDIYTGALVQKVIKGGGLGFSDLRHKAFFYQADPANLHAHMTDFDLILSDQVIERTYDPRKHIQQVVDRLKPGGIACFWSTFKGLDHEHHEPIDVTSPDALKAIVGETAELMQGPVPLKWNVPGVTRYNPDLRFVVLRRPLK